MGAGRHARRRRPSRVELHAPDQRRGPRRVRARRPAPPATCSAACGGRAPDRRRHHDAYIAQNKVIEWGLRTAAGHTMAIRGGENPTEKHFKVTLADGTKLYLGSDKVEVVTNSKSIELKSGDRASVLITDQGDVTVRGVNITIEATSKLDAQGRQRRRQGQRPVSTAEGGASSGPQGRRHGQARGRRRSLRSRVRCSSSTRRGDRMSDVADFIGRGITFPMRVDQSGVDRPRQRRRRHRRQHPHGPRHRARRAGDAPAVRLPHLGSPLRTDQRQHPRADGRGGPRRALAVGAARRRRGRRGRAGPGVAGPRRSSASSTGSGPRTTGATSSTRSTSSPTRTESMSLPVPNLDDRTFQDLVDEAKRLIPHVLPGVDEPQPHRPRRRADRAVRLDDRAVAVPAQPGARQVLHAHAQHARLRAVPGDRGAH